MERRKDIYLSDSDIVRIVETYSDMLLRIALNRVKSIPDIDVTAPVGSLTVRLTELMSRTEFDQLACYLLVEGEKPVPYSLSEIRMSINGGEALKTKSEMEWEQNHWNRVTPQPVADWNTDNSDTNYLTFPVEGNPLRAGTTFTLTGKLNGEAFALTYDFTEERYEQLRQTQLQEVGAMAAVIDAIPDETIPVNVTRHRRHWKPGKNSAFLCWI